MSDGFTKLFGSLIHSTIWREANHVRIVWVTMLAMVNRDGIVESSVPGLADAARVSIEECEEALQKLRSPDKYSRSKEFDGRRIADADGGWSVLNHPKYRKRMSAEDQREKTAARVRKHRANRAETDTDRDAPLPPVTVTQVTRNNDKAEAEANTDQNPPVVPLPGDAHAPDKPAKRERRKPRAALPADWRPTEGHLKHARELGLNCKHEYEKFRAQAEASGRIQVDWNAAFTQWLLNAENFAPRGPGRTAAPNAPLSEEARRNIRNNLLDDAKAGRHGPQARAWAESGKNLSALADKLELALQRAPPAVAHLVDGIGQ